MGLPSSREQLPTGPGSIIPSSTILAMEDCIIGHKRAAWVRSYYPIPVFLGPFGPGPSFNSATLVSTGAATGVFTIPCDEGDRFTSLSFKVFGNGSARCTMDVMYSDDATWPGRISLLSGSGNPFSTGAVIDINRQAAWGDLGVNPTAPKIIGPGGVLELLMQTNANGYQVGKMKAGFDRLL